MSAFKDLTGQRFGRLLVVQRASSTKSKWKCRCDCGNIVVVGRGNLKGGRARSCGCLRREITTKRVRKDLTGRRFGRLTVMTLSDVRGAMNQLRWCCLCDCGKSVVVYGSALRRGLTKSCGCYARETKTTRCLKDLTGQRFEKLTVLRRASTIKGNTMWECRCDCGKITLAGAANLSTGHTASCGCGEVRFPSGKNHPNYGKPPAHGKWCVTLKGHPVRSKYEQMFCDWLFIHNIDYEYEPEAFDFGTFTYTPDLFIPSWGVYVEIKGWWRDDALTKFEAFSKEHDIVLLEKSEIKSFATC